MSNRLRILKICMIIAAITFCVIVAISYIPRRVQQEFMGVELLVLGEQEYEILQTVDIRIDGRVRSGMFAFSPTFNGTFEVCAYDFTLNDATAEIFSFRKGSFLGGILSYRPFYRSHPLRGPGTLGMIFTDRNFSSIVIHITETVARDGGSYTEITTTDGHGTLRITQSYSAVQTNRVIAAPTTDANTALEMMRSNNLFWCDMDYRVIHYPWAGEPGAWFP